MRVRSLGVGVLLFPNIQMNLSLIQVYFFQDVKVFRNFGDGNLEPWIIKESITLLVGEYSS